MKKILSILIFLNFIFPRPVVYDKLENSIVKIIVKTSYGNLIGWGSGFLISKDGYIGTCYHVVKKATINNYNIEIYFENSKMKKQASIKYFDPTKDFAVLKIDKIKGKNYIPFAIGKSSIMRLGDTVYVAGYPQPGDYKVGKGEINSFHNLKDNLVNVKKCFDISIEIDHGNSGGPLVNVKGEVIGINAYIAYQKTVNYVIPIDQLKAGIKKAKKSKKNYAYNSKSYNTENDKEIIYNRTIKKYDRNVNNKRKDLGRGNNLITNRGRKNNQRREDIGRDDLGRGNDTQERKDIGRGSSRNNTNYKKISNTKYIKYNWKKYKLKFVIPKDSKVLKSESYFFSFRFMEMNFVIAPWIDYKNDNPVYVAKKGFKWITGENIKITSEKKLKINGFDTYNIVGNVTKLSILNVFSVLGYVDKDSGSRFYIRTVFPVNNNNSTEYISIAAKVLTSFSKMDNSDR